MSVRVLVTGSRNFSDRQRLFEVLDSAHFMDHIEVIIEGGAKGADFMAREWAQENNVPVLTFHADWATYKRAAGPIRNKQMLREGKPNLVLAFPVGEAKGTRHMIKESEKAGIETIVYEYL